MKYTVVPLPFLAVMLAALCLMSACSDRDGRVRSALEAADSLMMSSPEAALDTLLTVDSVTSASLRGRERADYTLLMTEARYKCYLPVAEDTAIFKAADYYRRKGPEDLLARALMMEGAVLSEQGDAEGAMLSYKEAEPIFERMGDNEQIGLVNSRIGDLYRYSMLSDSAALQRYGKALYYFERERLGTRIMLTHLTLASVLMSDSVEVALVHADQALRMARETSDRLAGIDAWMIKIYASSIKGQHDTVVSQCHQMFQEYGTEDQDNVETGVYNAVYAYGSESLSAMGKTKEARKYAQMISLRNAVDSLLYFSTMDKIAVASGHWKESRMYKEKS